jgi:hypothetical protein
MAGIGPLVLLLVGLMIVFLVLAYAIPAHRVYFFGAVVVCLVVAFLLFITGHAAGAAAVILHFLG